MSTPLPLNFPPGIQRDGTPFDAERCIDALWCRWRLSRPRKMGGRKRLTNALVSVPRAIHIYYLGNQTYVHVGTTSGIQQIVLDQSLNVKSVTDRTPVGFLPNASISWTMDSIFDTTSGAVQLVAHAVPDIYASSPVQTTPYLGILTATAALAPFSDPTPSSGSWVQPSVSGGIVCVQPYVFDFDSSGLVQWSAPNLPLYLGVTGGTSGAGQARISGQKIMAGMPLRGGGANQPAALFWSISEVITASFVGSSAGVFSFGTVSTASSILSTRCVVEYDGIYFWPGVDRFLTFNGTLSELPNLQNQDWFFDNLNRDYASRCFSFRNPRWGEIWFCAPLYGATECSHAAIYNVRENYWYDTALPNGGRGCGIDSQGFPYPLLGGVVADGTTFKLWLHEYGVDEVDGTVLNPIQSYFQTPWMGAPKNTPPNDEGISLGQLEPDIVQAGDMSVYLLGRANSRAPTSTSAAVPLKLVPSVPQEQFVSFKEAHRLVSLKIESNVLGGNYIVGRNLLHADKARDTRMFS